jgi:hypothetical protein
LAYAAHVAEEAFGGHGLAEWIIARGGLRLSVAGFIGLNVVGLAIITLATWAALRSPVWRWTLVSGGTILFVNGVCHVVASAAMRYYVPGMWTGLALYIPFGGALILYVRCIVSPRVFGLAIVAGFLIHAVVLWVVFGMFPLHLR